jgi:D-alanyl-D-alanine carboxypeptidase/D-alanyl-D-alanine-endopeptidase (penicillin-binding protein 4)
MMGMRFDVVAPPSRYSRAPLLLLLCVAIVPIVVLTGVVLWTDHRADQYEAVGTNVSPPGSSRPSSPAGAPLATGLMSFRRAPTAVAAVTADGRLAAQVSQIYGFLDDRSCAAVSVNGRLVTAHNELGAVIPASNQKLITAAVALSVLGPDHRSTTKVVGPAPVAGVVNGDLFLVGGGDPLLTSSDFPIGNDSLPAFNVTSLDQLADTLVAAGVTRVTGSLRGDGSRYDDEFAVASWAKGVAGVDAGPYDALMVNDSRILGRSSRQSDPDLAAAKEMVRLLAARGISVDGGAATGTAPTDAAVIGSIDSAPLSGVITEMLTNSDANTAELLLKEIGFKDSGDGSRAAGLNVENRVLQSWGIPLDGINLVDGSGLSADNRVTCAAILAILQRDSDGSLANAMAIAGQTGTLANEFVGSPVAGRLRAKTGTLDNLPTTADPPSVKALAGYLPAPNGDRVEFVLILNSADISLGGHYQPLWSAFAERLNSYPSVPDIAALGPR